MQWLLHLCKHSIVSLAFVLASITWGEELRAGGLQLSWNDNSDNEDGFGIERTIAGLLDKTISVGANTTSYIDSGLITGSIYCYRVRAFNSVGESAPTNQACAIAHDGIPGGNTSPSLAVSPTTVTAGDTVNVTWSGISVPSATDWIGLYSPGVANIGYIDRIHVSCSKTAGNALASGSCSYVLPARLAAGNYELRLFANDGFTRLATSNVLFVNSAITWTIAAGSTSPDNYELRLLANDGFTGLAMTNAFTVIAGASTHPGGTSPSLAVSPTTVSAGDTVNVTWSGISALSVTDWIGLYSPGIANTAYIDWIYVSCSKTAGNALASGSCSYVLPARLAAGNYELRLFANDGFTRLATSSVLFVNSAITWTIAASSASPFWTGWADYHLTLKMQSMSNNSMGVMFRYRDDKNYYRFLWNRNSSFRRLEKVQNGAMTVLATDSVAYTTSQSYQVEILVEGPAIGVLVDGSPVFFVADTSFSDGTIGLYSSSNPGTIFDDVTVTDFATGATLLSENFNSGSFAGWTTVDQSTIQGSSTWSAATGALTQSSNVDGTFALYTLRDWADYRMTLTMQSPDRDSIAVMFRYQDNNNYYRFSWNGRNTFRRLEKSENGVLTVLAEDLSGYVSGRTYQSEIIANGTTLQVAIDGALIFSVTDSSFSRGTIALYSNENQGSSFDDLLIEDLASGAVLLWEDFNDGLFTGWTIVDDNRARQGASAKGPQSGAVVQTSSIGSDASSYLGTYALY